MRRRTLDRFFALGGLALAILVMVLGGVLSSNASFADDYVHTQLAAQRITFTPVKGLSPDEQKIACLTSNAGKPMLTGKQAECYANEYIFGHLKAINNDKTYSETSTESRAAKTKADEALASNAANANDLNTAATILDAKTQSLFRGETLRGLLLTSFGFSEFGRKANQAATIAFLVGFVLLIASGAGFWHAFRSPATETVE